VRRAVIGIAMVGIAVAVGVGEVFLLVFSHDGLIENWLEADQLGRPPTTKVQ